MNGLQIGIFVIIISVFGAIFFAVQHGTSKDPASFSPVPTIQQEIQAPQQSNLKQPLSQSTQQQTVQGANTAQPTISAAEINNFKKASISATIVTSKGDIVVQLDQNEAPNTVINFMNRSQGNFYNNLTFHRVESWVIQGGDPLGTGTGGGKMPTELNQKPFTAGSLGIARGGDIKVSNDSQFFITKSDSSWLNGQYTNFGEVTSGMDVVNKIAIGDTIKKITIATH